MSDKLLLIQTFERYSTNAHHRQTRKLTEMFKKLQAENEALRSSRGGGGGIGRGGLSPHISGDGQQTVRYWARDTHFMLLSFLLLFPCVVTIHLTLVVKSCKFFMSWIWQLSSSGVCQQSGKSWWCFIPDWHSWQVLCHQSHQQLCVWNKNMCNLFNQTFHQTTFIKITHKS